MVDVMIKTKKINREELLSQIIKVQEEAEELKSAYMKAREDRPSAMHVLEEAVDTLVALLAVIEYFGWGDFTKVANLVNHKNKVRGVFDDNNRSRQ